jgi:DNA mismatch endonuclease (patch repair protein)
MRANRGRDTSPELAVRRLVHAQGLRYRVNARPEPNLRRTADMVFRRARVAVFIDGCFWHGCPEHHTVAKSNATYWAKKVTANRARDLETTAALTAAGWLVLRVWEHEEPKAAARLIGDTVRDALEVGDSP